MNIKSRAVSFAFVFFAAFVFFGAPPLSAQLPGVPPTPSGNPRDKMTEDRIRSAEIERVRREALKPEKEAETPRFPEIKEDFEKIQLLVADLSRPEAVAVAPDYGRVAGAAEEVWRRAARLRSNLFPAKQARRPAKKAVEKPEPADWKELLAALDAAVTSFAHNPTFTNLKVVDAEDSARARSDLDRVIRLSDLLRREAERLKAAKGN
jgi:hypothetical protein